MAAPNRMARSACAEPSLQIKNFIQCSSVGVTRQQTMNQHHCPNERQWNECHSYSWSAKELCCCSADLSANGRSSVHYQGNQNIHIPLESVRNSSITGRNNDLKQIGADRNMCRDSQQINQARHANVTCPAA